MVHKVRRKIGRLNTKAHGMVEKSTMSCYALCSHWLVVLTTKFLLEFNKEWSTNMEGDGRLIASK